LYCAYRPGEHWIHFCIVGAGGNSGAVDSVGFRQLDYESAFVIMVRLLWDPLPFPFYQHQGTPRSLSLKRGH
jgi:hypothetical protein